MKLRNKRTGELKECVVVPVDSNGYPNEYQLFEKGESLAELNEEWEDVPEEPKEYWHIFGTNITKTQECLDELYDKRNKEIGNYFETKEEAELAVRKLKAWKRLKDKGFKFIGVRGIGKVIDFDIPEPFNRVGFDEYVAGVGEKEFYNDLLLLFGGE